MIDATLKAFLWHANTYRREKNFALLFVFEELHSLTDTLGLLGFIEGAEATHHGHVAT